MEREQGAAEAAVAPPKEKLHVSVYTTSGPYPKKGTEVVSATDLVAEILKKAKHALKIADTSDWVVLVGGREIDPAKTYHQNGLTGTVTLNWGPRVGGGG